MFEDEVALTFKHQLGLILLGALIGFIPATANTWIQSSFQRRDLLYGRRLSLVRDLSSTNLKGASILAGVQDLQQTVDAAGGSTPSVQSLREIEARQARLNEQATVWGAQLKAQYEVLNALYGMEDPVPGYEDHLTPFSPSRPKGQQLAKIHDQLETQKASVVRTMRTVQELCEKISYSLNRQ